MYTLEPGQETQLHRYRPDSFYDWLLIDLWGKMAASGDMQKTMLSGSQSLLEFCKALATSETYLAYDQDGPYLAAWCEPVLCGISLGFWLRPDKRSSRFVLTLAHQLLYTLFERYPTVVVITKDPDVQKFHAHFGFTYACGIPHIYDGETAYISFLTRETYQEKYDQGAQTPDALPPLKVDDPTTRTPITALYNWLAQRYEGVH
jgi:hypothetical protein